MITKPSNYDTIRSGSHVVQYRVDINGTSYYGENIVGGSVQDALFEKFTIGTAVSRIFEINLDVDGDFRTADLYFRLYKDASTYTDWINKGKYFVATQENQTNGTVKVTCYDAMQKANAIYMLRGDWTSPYSDTVVSEIASRINVSIDTKTAQYLANNRFQIVSGYSIGDEGTTMREFLCYIAAVHCGCFYINDSGKLTLWRFDATYDSAPSVGSNASRLSQSPSVTVDRVICYVNDGAYYAPANLTDAQWNAMTGKVMSLDLPMATQAITNSLLSKLSSEAFKPFSANDAELDPCAELGDSVSIGGVSSVLTRRTFNLDSMGTANISADTENIVNDKYPYISGITREVERAMTGVSSRVTVLNNKVGLVVEETQSGNVIRAANIIASINDDTSSVKISAEKVDIEGQVTFADLDGSKGTTVINGSVIDTDTINLNNIACKGSLLTVKKSDGTIVGYLGEGVGKMIVDGVESNTDGVVLISPNSNYYVICTSSGVRMQAGTHSMYVTANGCYADGVQIGTAVWGS